MPYIVIKTCFPNERATEAAKKYIEVVEKYPADETITKVILDSAIDADEKGFMAYL